MFKHVVCIQCLLEMGRRNFRRNTRAERSGTATLKRRCTGAHGAAAPTCASQSLPEGVSQNHPKMCAPDLPQNVSPGSSPTCAPSIFPKMRSPKCVPHISSKMCSPETLQHVLPGPRPKSFQNVLPIFCKILDQICVFKVVPRMSFRRHSFRLQAGGGDKIKTGHTRNQ